MREMMGYLYAVHLAAGNREDVSLRAQRTLRQAALIVTRPGSAQAVERIAEDLAVPVLELSSDSQANVSQAIVDALQDGDVAWTVPDVADWTPEEETLLCRLLAQDVEVSPVPGASDLIAAIVLSGIPSDRFSFLGEMPSSSRLRRERLAQIAEERVTLVYAVREADVPGALCDVHMILGDRRLAAYSECGVWRGLTGEVPSLAGDIILIIDGAAEDRVWTQEQVRDQVCFLLQSGVSARDVAREVSRRSGWQRRAVYQIAAEMNEHR